MPSGTPIFTRAREGTGDQIGAWNFCSSNYFQAPGDLLRFDLYAPRADLREARPPREFVFSIKPAPKLARIAQCCSETRSGFENNPKLGNAVPIYRAVLTFPARLS